MPTKAYAGESLVFWYIESLRADFVVGNLAPHGVYTWNRRCEFPNQTPPYQMLNFTSQKQRMPGVRDNDPVSVSSRLLFTFGSI